MPAHCMHARFEFLKDLRAAHKTGYERDVRDPMSRFVADLATWRRPWRRSAARLVLASAPRVMRS